MIVEKRGNIFTTNAQTIVNTINCVGVMGAGIAYEFRLREPYMYEKYQILCHNKQLDIGILWIYNGEDKKILNFPTKYDWKYPSKIEYLEKGLQKFIDTYKEKDIKSIAFPLLGADKGGLTKEQALSIMTKYLSKCNNIDIEIWHFDPFSKDDLYEEFKTLFRSLNDDIIKKDSQIRIDIIKKIRVALEDETINSLSGLLRVKGVGDKSLEKLFQYVKNYKKNHRSLFDIEST